MDEKSIPSPTVSMALDANNIIQLPPIYATEVPTISDVEKGSESIGVTYKSDDKDDATGETLEPESISERPIHPPREDFTVFNSGQKKMIVFTASLASIFSPMATSIYCELVHALVMSATNRTRSIPRHNIQRSKRFKLPSKSNNHIIPRKY
jgi:hypothetical protein